MGSMGELRDKIWDQWGIRGTEYGIYGELRLSIWDLWGKLRHSLRAGKPHCFSPPCVGWGLSFGAVVGVKKKTKVIKNSINPVWNEVSATLPPPPNPDLIGPG